MKIAVISDMHFGYAPNKEQEGDPYDAVAEVAEKAADADLFLIPGDIFDMKVPSLETLSRAMEALIWLAAGEQPKLVKAIGSKAMPNHPGRRVVAIHGTHERRAEELVNPVQILEKAGFLIHLDRNGIVLEKEKSKGGEAASRPEHEKVAIQGLSGVPDQYTENELLMWDPKPEPGCFNVFMLHQNMTEFMPKQVEHTLGKEKLPEGFDIYLNGHIHRPEQSTVHGKPLIICGSLVPTQITRSMETLGFWEIDTSRKPSAKITFIPLEKQRKVFCIDMDEPDKKQIETEIAKILQKGCKKKPVIRVNIRGKPDQRLDDIKAKFGDRAFISFKSDYEESPASEGRTLEQHRLSVNELGAKLLQDNLKGMGLDAKLYERVFELLLEGRQDDALNALESCGSGVIAGEAEGVPGVPHRKHGEEPEEKQESPKPKVKKAGTGLGKFL